MALARMLLICVAVAGAAPAHARFWDWLFGRDGFEERPQSQAGKRLSCGLGRQQALSPPTKEARPCTDRLSDLLKANGKERSGMSVSFNGPTLVYYSKEKTRNYWGGCLEQIDTKVENGAEKIHASKTEASLEDGFITVFNELKPRPSSSAKELDAYFSALHACAEAMGTDRVDDCPKSRGAKGCFNNKYINDRYADFGKIQPDRQPAGGSRPPAVPAHGNGRR